MKVADTSNEEHTLPDAVDRLYAAVAGLIDPAKELVGGAVLAGPSAYEALLMEIPTSTSREVFSRGVRKSQPTIWCDALDLRVAIDRRVKDWRREGDSTPARLRALAASRWRPQDSGLVREYAAEVESWVSAIANMIDPPHIKGVSAPCPSCGRRWHYRHRDGEQIRQPALQLAIESGCTCGVCGAHWPPERFLFLCRLLGFDLPEGVTAPENDETAPAEVMVAEAVSGEV